MSIISNTVLQFLTQDAEYQEALAADQRRAAARAAAEAEKQRLEEEKKALAKK